MANRYVWQKYNVTQGSVYNSGADVVWYDIATKTLRGGINTTESFTLGTIGTAVSGGSISSYMTVSGSVRYGYNNYTIDDDTCTSNLRVGTRYYHKNGLLYYGTASVGYSGSVCLRFSPEGYITAGGYTKGSTNYGYVAATSSSSYPSNSYSGSYWYVYRGSDCIDPTAVGYSKTSGIRGGDTVTVNVTARSNTYGGTISYQYQYSTDGGSTWTNSGSKTTAVSQSMTIPVGVSQFRARVVASDNYGFTSTTYVAGSNLAVINGEIKACIDGVIKTCTPIVCVDGAIKTSISAYQCVDGVIKQS